MSRTLQHYTPNFILRGFADKWSRTLWVWDKSCRNCFPVRGKKSKGNLRYDVLASHDFYTIIDQQGDRDESVDRHLQQVEAQAAPIVRKLVRSAKLGNCAALDSDQKSRLVRFVWIQHARSPLLQSITDERRETFDRILGAYALAGFPPKALEHIRSRRDVVVSDASKLAITLEESLQSPKVMAGMTIDLGRVPTRADAYLVTSDRPCLIGSLTARDARIVMPLDKAVLLQLSAASDSPVHVHELDRHDVERLNRQTFEAATRFVAGPSLQHIHELASA